MNLTPYNNDGIELHINNETGEVFTSIRAAARMCGRNESVIRRFTSAAFEGLETAEVLTPSGLQGAALMTEEQLLEVITKYNPTLLAKFARLGGLRNYCTPQVNTHTEKVMNDNSSIIRGWNGRIIRQREDGYMSLTDMAQACDKRLNNWSQLESTKSYILTLSGITGIPAIELLQVKQKSGTWGHRKVALRFAQWCSDEFAIQVDTWVEELLTTGRVELSKSYLRTLSAVIGMTIESLVEIKKSYR